MTNSNMNPLPKNYEPITERLRGVPFDNWTEADMIEEETALRLDADDCRQKAESTRWLMDTIRPLTAAHPDKPVSELIALLPEPERSIAHDIVFATVPWSDLPVQRSQRKAWHPRVEQAIVNMLNQSEPFTTDEVLDEALVIKESERLQAGKYATKILFAASGRRIQTLDTTGRWSALGLV